MTAIQPVRSIDPPAASAKPESRRIAVLTRGIVGGGVQQMSLNLAAELVDRGWQVDLVSRKDGPDDRIPTGVRKVVLAKRFALRGRRLGLRAEPGGVATLLRPVLGCLISAEPLRYLPVLTDYLQTNRPRALFSATTYLNLVALWARELSGSDARVLVSERDSLSANRTTGKNRRAWRWRYAPELLARVYPRAEAIVAVSDGVADDLAQQTGIDRAAVRTVYNPVVHGDLAARAREPLTAGDLGDLAAWFAPGAPPVIVSAGRLVAKKQFGALLEAFARLRAERAVRLLVLGDGPERARLDRQIAGLGVGGDVRLHGWCDNPYPIFARAAAFALTSNREGFGNVLVEALHCGCPVVATDCPSGPSEILDGGRFGELVPVGDVIGIAKALARTLDDPPDTERLRARGAEFTTQRAADAYLAAVGLPLRPEVELATVESI